MAHSDSEVVDTCVRSMKKLQHEIQTSVAAITRNDLREFEMSLWRQEMVCSNLKRLLSDVSALAVDIQVMNDAAVELKSHSEIYARLIQRSRRSAAILQDLCSLYSTATRRVCGTNVKALCCEG